MNPIGYIYKIFCLTTGYSYIGHTTKTVEKRMKEHKNLKYNDTTSYSIILEDNYEYSTLCEIQKIEYILHGGDKTIKQFLVEYEQLFMDITDNVINKNKAYLTPEEKENYNKNWRLKNIEKCIAYDRDGYDCLCGGIVKKNYPIRHMSTIMHNNFLKDEENYLDMREQYSNLKFGTRENIKIEMSLQPGCIELKDIFLSDYQDFKNELFQKYMMRKIQLKN